MPSSSVDTSDRPLPYQFDLDHQLETCIQQYEEARQEWWQGNSRFFDSRLAEMAYAEAEQAAQVLLKGAEDFVTSDGLVAQSDEMTDQREKFLSLLSRVTDGMETRGFQSAGPEWPDRPDPDSTLKLVWERLCIHLAWDTGDYLRTGAVRILQMWQLFLEVRPSRTTIRYLQRLARCFVSGFDPECIILCRSVLDDAFREAIPDRECECFYSRAKPADDFGLSKRIVTAFNIKHITRQTKAMAFKVIELGNTAIHFDPLVTQNALGTIRDTMVVLERLLKEAEAGP